MRQLALRQERLVGPGAVLGGLLVTGGAFLPWLSFYAGLYPLRGVIGVWGRLLAVAGVLCALIGARAWWRGGRAGRLTQQAIAIGSGAMVLFALWLLAQLALTMRALQKNPMIVPRLGPGLFVVLAGAVVALAPALAEARRRG